MNIKLWAKVAAPIVVGVGMGLGIPSLTAVGQSSPPASAITLGNTATLVAKGVSASVPITVTCPSGNQGQIEVSLSERSGKAIVQGQTFTFVTCTGAPQSLVIAVAPQGQPFKSGVALGTASLFSFCFPGNNCNAVDSHTVKLTSK